MVNSLEVVMGPMFSGKTTYILKKIESIEDSISSNYILIKPKIDNRYEDSVESTGSKLVNKSYITSHDRKMKECRSLDNLLSVIDSVRLSADSRHKITIEPEDENYPNSSSDSVNMIAKQSKEGSLLKNFFVIVDEAQFFGDLLLFCKKCLEIKSKTNINLLICGLDGDYKREPIGQILNVIPLSDKVTKLTGKCTYCENKSIFTKRIITNKEQVLIGGEEAYRPVCRNHYLD